jgi:hypothetical protein
VARLEPTCFGLGMIWIESKIHKLDVHYSIAGEGGKSPLTVESNIHWKFPMNIMSMILGRRIEEGILKQMESEFAELKRLCEEEKVPNSISFRDISDERFTH